MLKTFKLGLQPRPGIICRIDLSREFGWNCPGEEFRIDVVIKPETSCNILRRKHETLSAAVSQNGESDELIMPRHDLDFAIESAVHKLESRESGDKFAVDSRTIDERAIKRRCNGDFIGILQDLGASSSKTIQFEGSLAAARRISEILELILEFSFVPSVVSRVVD